MALSIVRPFPDVNRSSGTGAYGDPRSVGSRPPAIGATTRRNRAVQELVRRLPLRRRQIVGGGCAEKSRPVNAETQRA